MDYIKELEIFHDWCEVNYLSNTAKLMWFKLMHLGFNSGW